MKKNFNKSTRFIRLGVGAIFIVLALVNFLEDPFLENVLLGVGCFLVVTALIYFCPLYYFLGINGTKRRKKANWY